MELLPFTKVWAEDDPHANFKAEVASYTRTDPLPALRNLSELTGIPVECLIRYVLVKWAASGAEALLSMGPVVFRQMEQHVAEAETRGTDEARIRAYCALKEMISWLAAAKGQDRS